MPSSYCVALRILVLLSVLLNLAAGNRHQMRWRKETEKDQQSSRNIEKEAVKNIDDDADLDLFRDDEFFKGSALTAGSPGTKNISIQFPQITIPQFTLPQIPTINFDKTSTGVNLPDKSATDLFGDSTNGVKDFLLGLVGFSSTQQSVRPIIMILLALATGIFWCKVFLYIYTSFFSGGGWFSSESESSFPYGRSLVSNMNLENLTYTADLILRTIDAFHEHYYASDSEEPISS